MTSPRARAACGLAVAAGFFTLPLNGLLVLIGFAAGDVSADGAAWIESAGAWAGYAVAAVLAWTAFGLGLVHRRGYESGGDAPVEPGLARAGELLGVAVGLLALFLLMGTAMQRGWV